MKDITSKGVLVLGMHRSGTSATAGALARLGFHLGSRLVPPAADNRKGYFEHADVVGLNDRILTLLGRAWDDVRALPDGWVRDPRLAALVAEMREAVLPAVAAATPWVIKDPRMSRVLPLWRGALEAKGRQLGCVLVLRHPHEVAASLSVRDAMPPRQASLLWLRHVLEAARASEGLARHVLTYDALLAAPADALHAALGALGMPVPAADPASALMEFVDHAERHHEGCVPATEDDPWSAFAADAYSAILHAGDAWHAIREVDAEFSKRMEDASGWIGTLGAATTAVRVVQAGLRGELLETQRRAEVLQSQCDQSDHALAEAQALCASRLEELTASDRRVREAEAALLEAQALVARYRAQADRLQTALGRAEDLAAERLEALHVTSEQLARTQSALADAERIALERLSRLGEHETRLGVTDEALATATALCESRLTEVHLVEAAKAVAEALAIERLAQLESASIEIERLRTTLQRIQDSKLWGVFTRLSRQWDTPAT